MDALVGGYVTFTRLLHTVVLLAVNVAGIGCTRTRRLRLVAVVGWLLPHALYGWLRACCVYAFTHFTTPHLRLGCWLVYLHFTLPVTRSHTPQRLVLGCAARCYVRGAVGLRCWLHLQVTFVVTRCPTFVRLRLRGTRATLGCALVTLYARCALRCPLPLRFAFTHMRCTRYAVGLTLLRLHICLTRPTPTPLVGIWLVTWLRLRSYTRLLVGTFWITYGCHFTHTHRTPHYTRFTFTHICAPRLRTHPFGLGYFVRLHPTLRFLYIWILVVAVGCTRLRFAFAWLVGFTRLLVTRCGWLYVYFGLRCWLRWLFYARYYRFTFVTFSYFTLVLRFLYAARLRLRLVAFTLRCPLPTTRATRFVQLVGFVPHVRFHLYLYIWVLHGCWLVGCCTLTVGTLGLVTRGLDIWLRWLLVVALYVTRLAAVVWFMRLHVYVGLVPSVYTHIALPVGLFNTRVGLLQLVWLHTVGLFTLVALVLTFAICHGWLLLYVGYFALARLVALVWFVWFVRTTLYTRYLVALRLTLPHLLCTGCSCSCFTHWVTFAVGWLHVWLRFGYLLDTVSGLGCGCGRWVETFSSLCTLFSIWLHIRCLVAVLALVLGLLLYAGYPRYTLLRYLVGLAPWLVGLFTFGCIALVLVGLALVTHVTAGIFGLDALPFTLVTWLHLYTFYGWFTVAGGWLLVGCWFGWLCGCAGWVAVGYAYAFGLRTVRGYTPLHIYRAVVGCARLRFTLPRVGCAFTLTVGCRLLCLPLVGWLVTLHLLRYRLPHDTLRLCRLHLFCPCSWTRLGWLPSCWFGWVAVIAQTRRWLHTTAHGLHFTFWLHLQVTVTRPDLCWLTRTHALRRTLLVVAGYHLRAAVLYGYRSSFPVHACHLYAYAFGSHYFALVTLYVALVYCTHAFWFAHGTHICPYGCYASLRFPVPLQLGWFATPRFAPYPRLHAVTQLLVLQLPHLLRARVLVTLVIYGWLVTRGCASPRVRRWPPARHAVTVRALRLQLPLYTTHGYGVTLARCRTLPAYRIALVVVATPSSLPQVIHTTCYRFLPPPLPATRRFNSRLVYFCLWLYTHSAFGYAQRYTFTL